MNNLFVVLFFLTISSILASRYEYNNGEFKYSLNSLPDGKSGVTVNMIMLFKQHMDKINKNIENNLKNIVKDALKVLYQSGQSRKKITLLHCNSEYPTNYKDVNLLAMQTIRKKFNVDVGYSDHTNGFEVAIGAVSLIQIIFIYKAFFNTFPYN